MRTIFSGIAIAVFLLPAVASAEAISNDMSCEEAVAHFEEHGRIDTIDEGQVLPIDEGVPVSKRNDLVCDEGELPGPVLLKTKDKAECAVSYACPEA